MPITTEIPGMAPRIEILVVEDNLGDAFLLHKYLENSKIPNNVTVLRDGLEAMDFLKKREPYPDAQKPDIIFLDLNLPGKDGRVILREIKEDPDLKDIKVLVLTASTWEQDVTQAYDFEADLYLMKPPDLEQFIACMKYVEDTWLKVLSARKH